MPCADRGALEVASLRAMKSLPWRRRLLKKELVLVARLITRQTVIQRLLLALDRNARLVQRRRITRKRQRVKARQPSKIPIAMLMKTTRMITVKTTVDCAHLLAPILFSRRIAL